MSSRGYPDRPFVAVSGAIFRDQKVLVVRRARRPALGLYTVPGGVVELGETLTEALVREVREETSLDVEPVALAGYRDVVARDAAHRVQRHFIVVCFSCKWLRGEFTPNEELEAGSWLSIEDVAPLRTTEGLLDILKNAQRQIA